MAWGYNDSRRPVRRHEVPDRSGDTRAPGDAGQAGGTKPYKHERMTRDEAESIQIAVGLVTGGMPIERRAIGEGFSILVPAEWWRDKHLGVKAILARGGRR